MAHPIILSTFIWCLLLQGVEPANFEVGLKPITWYEINEAYFTKLHAFKFYPEKYVSFLGLSSKQQEDNKYTAPHRIIINHYLNPNNFIKS